MSKEPTRWKFTCRKCGTEWQMPIKKGITEQEYSCPKCGTYDKESTEVV